MNSINEFYHKFYKYLINEEIHSSCNILRCHTDKFKTIGELSFPQDTNVWKCLLKAKNNNNSTTTTDKDKEEVLDVDNFKEKINNLIEESTKWLLPISSVKIIDNRYHIFLDRERIMKAILYSVIENETDYGLLTDEKKKNLIINIKKEPSTIDGPLKVTEHRLNLIYDVIVNLTNLSSFTITNDTKGSEINSVIYLGTKSNVKGIEFDHKIVCGAVYDPKFGTKAATITADEYIK